MKQLILAAPLLALTACGGEADTPANEAAEGDAPEAMAAEAEVDAEEAAKRRESQIATWGANFGLSEAQASCLVDSVGWDDLIAAEQSPETVEQITACDADPATFAGYGQ
mgnify:CR=1 FL=1